MHKIRDWLDETPSPNEGRIRELREAVKKGRYPTRKMIRATADEILARFEGKKAL
jgi:hypothetical protein